MMMSKGANMFNKQKPQKKRPAQHDAKEDEHQQEQWTLITKEKIMKINSEWFSINCYKLHLS